MRKILVTTIMSSLLVVTQSGYAKEDVTAPTASEIKNTKIVTNPTKTEDTTSPLTGTFAITTNDIFRGLSQSNNLPAFQGGFTYTFATTGIYANLWGSNVSLLDKDGNTATLEIDTIAGVTNTIGENFSYNVYFNRYNYPKAAGLNYNELIADLSYYFVIGGIGYSNNVYDKGQYGTYYYLGVNYTIPPKYVFNFEDVAIKATAAHYKLPNVAGHSYNDYLFQVSKTIGNYNLAVAWTDACGAASPPLDGYHLIGTVTVSF